MAPVDLTANAPVPKLRGVYAIKNTATGHIYIGSARTLSDRYTVWRYRLKNRLASKVLLGAIAVAPPDRWIFVVLVASDDLSLPQMYRLEQAAIDRARAAGAKVLNVKDAPLRRSRDVG